jgi:hydroxymethylglutaryl-CoA synthase
MIKAGMAIGSDAAQGKPHDALEYAAAAAGAAILLGEEAHSIARVIATASYTSDTPDFWRRDGIRYPSHAGRFSGEPAYFTHVMGATRRIFDTTGYKPQDFAYCIFHMPNGKFPRDVAKRLGFTKEQLSPSLTVDQIGNPYSASALIGLCAVLDQARPKEKILFVSYGSGAGSDAFVFETKDAIRETQKRRKEGNMTVSDDMNNTKRIDYSSYLRLTHSI